MTKHGSSCKWKAVLVKILSDRRVQRFFMRLVVEIAQFLSNGE